MKHITNPLLRGADCKSVPAMGILPRAKRNATINRAKKNLEQVQVLS